MASHGLYRPRAPEHGVLWQCVHEHLPAFLARAADSERALPSFVTKELEGFLACGLLEHGFARVACGECGFARLVPFSCKGRGVCPSCVSRRMSETAARLVDHVLPEVPVRQWVLSVPAPLRYLLAWDTTLCAALVRIFMQAVTSHLAALAKREGVVARRQEAHSGAVCMVQRWGGSVNLNVHLHALVADGVFVGDGSDAAAFHTLPAPDAGAIAAVAWRVCEQVVRLLRKRGQWLDEPSGQDELCERAPMLAQLYGASIAGTLVMGPRAGERQVRLFGAPAREPHDEESPGKLRNAYGFDLDARVRIEACDRAGIERLARYMTRPALSKGRLTRQEDGRYRITLKRAWRDGTTHIVLDGVELVGRLASLVPPPRFHLTRYFGVFAPRSKLRRAVVPGYGTRDGMAAGSQDGVAPTSGEGSHAHGSKRRMSWAKLLARVFALDVLACPRCDSRMQRVEWCLLPARIAAVLGARGPPEDEHLACA